MRLNREIRQEIHQTRSDKRLYQTESATFFFYWSVLLGSYLGPLSSWEDGSKRNACYWTGLELDKPLHRHMHPQRAPKEDHYHANSCARMQASARQCQCPWTPSPRQETPGEGGDHTPWHETNTKIIRQEFCPAFARVRIQARHVVAPKAIPLK